MSYDIIGDPVCGIQLGFFGAGNSSYNYKMLSHGPVDGNHYGYNQVPWLCMPFPIKVYAISFTTDSDGEYETTCSFRVRKSTGDTYGTGTGTGTGTDDKEWSYVQFTNIDDDHHEYRIFPDTTTNPAPTFAAGESLGLMLNSGRLQCEFTVKLWCYQI
jgi:hypothetical protein